MFVHEKKSKGSVTTQSSNGTPPCAFKEKLYGEGSYTVEAALIFPVFLLAMVTIFCLLRAVTVQYMVRMVMNETAFTLAASDFTDDDEKVKILLLSDLEMKTAVNKEIRNGVYGGLAGVNYLTSEVNSEYIIVRAKYKIKTPAGFFSDKIFNIEDEIRARRFRGWKGDADDDSTYVYVTKNGKAYHRSRSCPYLKPSTRIVDRKSIKKLRNKDGSKYKACSCAKGAEHVYITDYGNQFHGKLSCSDLKRDIRRIRLDDAGNYHACSKCCGKEKD